MKVGVTGHRPERIPNPDGIKALIAASLQHFRAGMLYQGMAAGVDLWSAKEAWKLKIPYVCVKPWEGHKPRVADQIEYGKVIKHSAGVVSTDPSHDYLGPWLYQRRNEWIVNNSDVMIAVWDGNPYGGTYRCIEYAWSKAVPVFRLDPEVGLIGFVSEEVPF